MFLMKDLKALLWQRVNLPWLKTILQTQIMWHVVGISLLPRNLDDMQKEERFTGIASNDFHENLCWI